MPEKNIRSRRRLLKTIAGAGGLYTAGRLLPETWTRPVVDAVTLPAHAQTSGVYFGSVDDIASAPPAGNGILDLIVPAAHAVVEIPPEAYICVVPAGDEAQVDVVLMNLLTLPGTGAQFSGMVPINGVKTDLNLVDLGDGCKIKTDQVSVRLDALARGRLFVDGDAFRINFDLPLRDCNLPDLGSCIIVKSEE